MDICADIEREAAIKSIVHILRAPVKVNEVEIGGNIPFCDIPEYDFDLLLVKGGKFGRSGGGNAESGAMQELVVEFTMGGIDYKIIASAAEFREFTVTGGMKAAMSVPFCIPHGDEAFGDIRERLLDEADTFGDDLHIVFSPLVMKEPCRICSI